MGGAKVDERGGRRVGGLEGGGGVCGEVGGVSSGRGLGEGEVRGAGRWGGGGWVWVGRGVGEGD